MGEHVSPRARGDATRAAFVSATARLLQRQGYAASGLNEIVAASGAPKGSLYFHFPGGKEELARAAIGRAGANLAEAIQAILADHEDVGAGLAALIDALAAGLQASNYADGCPVATVALETATASVPLRTAAAEAFTSWLIPLRDRLESAGMPPGDAERRAILVLSALEGALLLARAEQSQVPLLAVRDELAALASAWAKASPSQGRRAAVGPTSAATTEKPARRKSREESRDEAPRRDRQAR